MVHYRNFMLNLFLCCPTRYLLMRRKIVLKYKVKYFQINEAPTPSPPSVMMISSDWSHSSTPYKTHRPNTITESNHNMEFRGGQGGGREG